ncbi:lysophospholipase [Amylibacter marinus]|uniref:Lysophospholipase n=1 Tax=Amylibacter marinus TaxID=1475483 RepID=A0ABQ5VYR3_9RHOB|nr:DUF1489 domain-containing protein [Amylibacter marinus]GLQ36221.1 lysophospholipase [Amylibacter marinus]
MQGKLHLIKLSVGTEDLSGLEQWQKGQRLLHGREHGLHITRMWPKRESELLSGGSIYWVIKGAIQARQRLVRFDEIIGDDGIRRCGFVLDPEIIATTMATRRPFQGWRYLAGNEAPKDMPKSRASEPDLPDDMEQHLADLGLL